jgi:hypothetical protein
MYDRLEAAIWIEESRQAVAMDFAHWVGLLAPCFYHDRKYSETTHWVNQVLAYHDVPEFWREPVRVMAQGGWYYGADEWMAKYAPYQD